MTTRTFFAAKFFTCVLLFLLFCSCGSSSYYFVASTYKTGVDFRQGKWLLNRLDCPANSQEKLTLETVSFFENYTKNRFYLASKTKGLLMPSKIALHPNKEQLKALKDGTGFDFFINIRGKINKNDYGDIGIYSDEKGKNESHVVLEIYDLNLQQIIYSKSVVGVSKKSSDAFSKKSDKLIDNIEFFKNPNQLMLGSLKKIFSDLKKTSLKK